jgi:hypothetical protein
MIGPKAFIVLDGLLVYAPRLELELINSWQRPVRADGQSARLLVLVLDLDLDQGAHLRVAELMNHGEVVECPPQPHGPEALKTNLCGLRTDGLEKLPRCTGQERPAELTLALARLAFGLADRARHRSLCTDNNSGSQ